MSNACILVIEDDTAYFEAVNRGQIKHNLVALYDIVEKGS